MRLVASVSAGRPERTLGLTDEMSELLAKTDFGTSTGADNNYVS